jgi:hypothetical protein
MNTTSINAIRRSGRLKLSNLDAFFHYSIVFAFMIGPMLCLYHIYQIEIEHHSTSIHTSLELFNMAWPLIIAATSLALIQWRKLNFKRLKVTSSAVQFIAAVRAMQKEMKWKVGPLTKNFAIATSRVDFLKPCVQITIIRSQKEILINSILCPDNASVTFSCGQNALNIKAFKQKLIELTSAAKHKV